jgi:hypothetical protein
LKKTIGVLLEIGLALLVHRLFSLVLHFFLKWILLALLGAERRIRSLCWILNLSAG